jgi:hypothetical protein
MSPAQKLKVQATSLPVRVLILLFAIAWLAFLGPSILMNLINPQVAVDALIAAYFLAAGIVAFVFFFSKKVFQLLFVLPVAAYGLVGLVWSFV